MGSDWRVECSKRTHSPEICEEAPGRERVAERHADLAPREHGEVLRGEGLATDGQEGVSGEEPAEGRFPAQGTFGVLRSGAAGGCLDRVQCKQVSVCPDETPCYFSAASDSCGSAVSPGLVSLGASIVWL